MKLGASPYLFPFTVAAWFNLAEAINSGDATDVAFGIVGVGMAGGGRFLPIFVGNNATFARGARLMQNGKPLAEYDNVRLAMIIEDEDGSGLPNLNNQQTPAEWAKKKIFHDTLKKIRALRNEEAVVDMGGDKPAGFEPAASWIRAIRTIRYRFKSTAPELQAAVAEQVKALKQAEPGFDFEAEFGE